MTNPQSRTTATDLATTDLATTDLATTGFSTPEDDSALALAYAIAAAADERKAGNIVILQVGDVSYLADYFVVATGFSTVQVRAITRSIEATLEDDWNRRPLRMEGQTEGNWVLMDYGEVIVHVFMPEAREFYDLEAFWGHANQMLYQAPPRSQPSLG